MYTVKTHCACLIANKKETKKKEKQKFRPFFRSFAGRASVWAPPDPI